MTIWDNIYKNYQNGGQAWATLSEGIDQRFIEYINKTDFKLRSALDIGCGTGKYLKFLEAKGFTVSGIDSSETAVQITKKSLQDSSNIIVVDMYSYPLVKNKFDLILSVSTLHHGTKEQIKKLIDQIFDCLPENGKVFITLPDMECNKKWNTFKDDKEIAPGTYSPLSGPEKGLPHSFFSREEIEKLFDNFRGLILETDEIGRWFITGGK